MSVGKRERARQRKRERMAKHAIFSAFKASSIVGYQPGEPYQNRHWRRYLAALKGYELIKAWCEFRSVNFRTRRENELDHWMWIFRGERKFLNWSPYTARCHLKLNWLEDREHRIKVYDYEQLLKVLEWWITGVEP